MYAFKHDADDLETGIAYADLFGEILLEIGREFSAVCGEECVEIRNDRFVCYELICACLEDRLGFGTVFEIIVKIVDPVFDTEVYRY